MQSKTIPLHPAQEDVYTDQLINIRSPHYNIGGYVILKGPLQKEKLIEAVNSAPLVFDSFKMRFDLDEPDFLTHLDDTFGVLDFPEIDFSEKEDAGAYALGWMQGRFNTSFVFNKRNALFEHYLLKISNDEHWFFGRYHHLITDGFGFIVFIKYVARKYHSLKVEDNSQFNYPFYNQQAVDAATYKNSADYISDEIYWSEKLNGQHGKFLRRKYEPADDIGKKSLAYTFDFTSQERTLLETIQSDTGAGFLQLTIAALIIYFGKTSEESGFVFGIPLHKRGSRTLRNTFGMFSGILPYKSSYESEMTLGDLLKGIAKSQKNDYRHYNYPVGDISRLLTIKSSEGYLCDVIINYELLDFEIIFDEQIRATVLQLSSEYQRNPLQLSWRDYGKQQPLQLHINFLNEYFSALEIELLVRRIIFIIEQFPARLAESIADINVLPETEKQLLETFSSATVNDDFENANIIELFEAQVKQTPGAVAIVFENQKVTYHQLNERSNQVAHFLIQKGVKEGILVPLCIERSIDMIVGMLGILKAGAAYVPIDPDYPPDRIQFMLGDIGSKIILSSRACRLKILYFESLELVELDMASAFENQPVINTGMLPGPGTLAYIIYTSGSTGKPKGVMIEHRSVVNLVKAQTKFFNITSDEKILQFSNFCFDASVEQIFLALLNGVALILFKEGLQLNMQAFGNFLKEKEITHLHATPFFLENLQGDNYNSLKRVIAGGDVCKKQLSDHWKNRLDFFNEYGPTETTITAVEYHDSTHNGNPNVSLPIGKPVANVTVYILDGDGNFCPIGESGEIYIGGVQVARGYLNRPELTRERFIHNPFIKDSGSKLYKTGDVGRWLPDGNIMYEGRKDEQVKIRGYRIELGEIENILLQHHMVKQAVVLAGESKNDKRLVGYVVPDGSFEKKIIQSYLRTKLPEYMVPALWVELEKLPLTSNGKIDRQAFPEPNTGEVTGIGYVAPANKMQAVLVNIWQELLKVARVGIEDDFFNLGGHSINAIQLVSRLHKQLNIKTDIATIFANPTIKELSKVLASEKITEFEAIKLSPLQAHYQLSHAQKRIWILSHLKDGSTAYSVPVAFVIQGKLNVKYLARAFNKIIERHENLRTVFIEIDGEPRQLILPLPVNSFHIEEVDLKDNGDPKSIINKKLQSESRIAFDLTSSPLLRATLFKEREDSFTFIFNIHHIISDGWSKKILVQEILTLYKNYLQGVNATLPPLPIQYKDYSCWHNALTSNQAGYWRNLYKKNIPVLNFPTDFERPKVLSFSGDLLKLSLNEALTSSLKESAFHHKMTLNNFLFAIYGLMVAQYCRQDEVVIGSLVSGRSHIDLEKLIGLFMNFLPVRFSVNKNLSLSKFLADMKQTLVEAYSNQNYPFDLMVEDCIIQRDISHNPFFDTMVNFHSESNANDGTIFEATSENDISIHPYPVEEVDFFHSVLDFKLDIELTTSRIICYLNYNTNLYTRKRMNSFLQDFEILLQKVMNDDDNYLYLYFEEPAPEVNILNENPGISGDNVPDLSVIICASFVAEPLKEYMLYWSNEFDIKMDVSFSPYNQVFQQLFDSDGSLLNNKGVNILFIRITDWIRDKSICNLSDQLAFLDGTYGELLGALDHANKHAKAPFIAGVVPVITSDDIKPEVREHIRSMNIKLESFLKMLQGFQIIDLDEIAALYLVEEIFDRKADELGHIPFTREFYAALGTFLSRKIRVLNDNSFKVIVVDCDNTLWKGVCGELGALQVTIDDSFSYLQQFLLNKRAEGFLLAICSKNNEPDVWEVFSKHPGMILKPEHIAAHQINWKPKHENLVTLAGQLNLGIESFIFLDDSHFEVEQMATFCPEILSLALPGDTDEFFSFLNHNWAFDRFTITNEDVQRSDMYVVEKLRKTEEVNFRLLDDFIKSLDIKVNIRIVAERDLPRAVQLSQRTNQFNLNGIVKSREAITDIGLQTGALSWIIEVTDRFGDYGVVGLLLAVSKKNVLVLETFMLSCRVLGRNVENIILSELQTHCEKHDLHSIEALFLSTKKNQPFVEFLSRTNWVENRETATFFLHLNTSGITLNENIMAAEQIK